MENLTDLIKSLNTREARRETTCLTKLLRSASPEEREYLANHASTTVSYLYALAGCHREAMSLDLGLRLAEATRDLARMTKGRTPVLSAEQLALMCPLRGFVPRR
jgi:hypothetical protein